MKSGKSGKVSGPCKKTVNVIEYARKDYRNPYFGTSPTIFVKSLEE